MRKLFDLKHLIGNTPIIEIKYSYKNKNRTAYMKAEWFNLTGSIKDRVAYNILSKAIKRGELKQGQPIVEVTSGNMGISLSAIGGYLGHKVVVFMPENMSEERKKILLSYGAELHLTKDFKSAFNEAEEYVKAYNAYRTNQFDNIENTLTYKNTLAKEIVGQIGCNFDSVVAGVGTSGTIMGLSSVFKKLGKKIYAVEPKSSSLLSMGKSMGKHKIQGLSDDIVPSLYKKENIDGVISIEDDDAIAMAHKLGKYGLGVGVSGGANFLGCVLSENKISVSIFPDDNKKYLQNYKNNVTTKLVNAIKIKGIRVIKIK